MAGATYCVVLPRPLIRPPSSISSPRTVKANQIIRHPTKRLRLQYSSTHGSLCQVTIESEEAAAEAALAAALKDNGDASRPTADVDENDGEKKRANSGVVYGWTWPAAR